MKTRLMPLIVFVTMLAIGLGCAKPDWIQQTLVTVDVTGAWIGSLGKASGYMTDVRLELQQQGAKVTGKFLPTLPAVWGGFEFRSGSLEGTVHGDVFTFQVTNSSIAGEVTVSGDEMQGYTTVGGRSLFYLRRVSSTLPASQP